MALRLGELQPERSNDLRFRDWKQHFSRLGALPQSNSGCRGWGRNEAVEMRNSNNDIEELEELLTELEGQEAQIVTPYSEEDDAVTRLMDAPLGDQDWMVQVTALDRRMMSTSQVLNELSLGKINQRTLVWRGGMDDWMPLSRVDELSRASAPPMSAMPRA